MVLFFKRYLKALSLVGGIMLIYCLTVARWIEPTQQTQPSIPLISGASSGNRWWEPLFSPQDWQNQQPTIIQNDRGVLLAKKWEQEDQRTWKLTPLTIVMSQQDTQNGLGETTETAMEAWVIDAPEGATIHFDRPLDLKSGRVPSIERGQLQGKITIRRVSLATPQLTSLQLSTGNLSIDRRQIWTQDELTLATNDLFVKGRGVRIHLKSDILSQKSVPIDDHSDSRFGPLEELELMQLSEARMRLPQGGIWAGVDPELLQQSVPVEQLPAFIDAKCGGRFSLNFNKGIATLNGGVHVRHHLGNFPPDEFQCHRIQLKFELDADPKSAALTNDQLAGISIREIEAFGIDSLEDFVGEMWVEFKSPLANASARAKRVRYDFRNQRIELSGKLNQPGATLSVAELNFKGNHLRAPLLEYQAAPKNPDGKPQHGGWMVAQGAGEISTPAESQMGEIHVRWQDRFQWSPADRPGEQRMEIVGQTLIESKQRGFVTADRLQLWLNHSSQQADSPSDIHTATGLRPRRLVTLGPTLIGAGNHRMQVESVDLSFVYPPGLTPHTQPGLKLQDSAGNPMFQFLSPPKSSEMSPSEALANQELPVIQLAGRSLVGSVAMGEPVRMETMTLQGPLSFKSLTPGNSAPVEIYGETLVMATMADGNVDLEIEGKPAQVKLADGSIEGPSIRFNQRENQVWIDHPGNCTLPSGVLSSLRLESTQPEANHSDRLQSSITRWEMPLRCQWQGRMLFDGQTVQLDGGIRIQGALQRDESLWLIEGLCQSLSLRLSQSVFSNNHPMQPSPPAQLEEIILSRNVDLRLAQRDSEGLRKSLQRLQVPEVRVLVPQGKVVAVGPGQGLAKFQAGRSLGALAGSSDQNQPQLQCAHLTFRDSLTGLLSHNEIVADGNVKIATSPIRDWDEDFLPQSMVRIEPGQMIIASDQLKLLDTSSLNSTQAGRLSSASAMDEQFWEVQATGNVTFEGNADSGDYSGNAYQITFVQSKDLLSLRGDGRSKAVLHRNPKTSSLGGLQTIQVPLLSLNVRTMAVDIPQGGLDVQVDFHGGTDNNKPFGQTGGDNSSTSSSVPSPNPRNSINNFLRGY